MLLYNNMFILLSKIREGNRERINEHIYYWLWEKDSF